MAVTNKVYTQFLSNAIGSTTIGNAPDVDWLSDTIQIALVNGYTFNQNTHAFWSDAVASEVPNGSGYTTNGATLGTKTQTSTALVTTLGSASPSWAASTFTTTGAVIYDRTPATDATRPLIAYIDFGGAQSPSAGTFSITFTGGNILTITVS